MNFLITAEKYAEARGDDMWFKNVYTYFREYNGVEDSVWKTLAWLYDEDTARLLKYQYWGPSL